MEMKYRVYDRKTLEDITDKYNWVVWPDGSLYLLEYSDLIGYPDAYYEIVVKKDNTWEKVYDGYTR